MSEHETRERPFDGEREEDRGHHGDPRAPVAILDAGAAPRRVTAIRTLVVAGRGKLPEAEIRRLIAQDAMPDAISTEDAINATYVDDRLFETVGGLRGALLRALPFRLAQLVEVYRRGHSHEAVLTWSDLPSVLVAALMRVWPRRPAHVALLSWPSKPKKALLLRLVHGSIDRFVVCAPLQRRFLIEQIGIPEERLIDCRFPVDTRFWRPMDTDTDLICAVGQEMRDYATLVEALGPLEIPCHIAVGTSFFGTTAARWWEHSLRPEALPAAVTVGPKNFVELRELYARARFVVVPLLPSDNDNGITTILEAFAMGKAVIATESPGQVGVLEHGVNCLRVPPHDPLALREAITQLWADPERCARLGAAGRELALARHGLDQWTDVLVAAVEEAVGARRRKSRG